MAISPEAEEFEHNIEMDEVKKSVQTTLLSIMKEWASGIKGEKDLMETFTKELYVSIHGSRSLLDLYQLRVLMFRLCNESYAGWLLTLARFLNGCDKNSLWGTLNNKIDNQI